MKTKCSILVVDDSADILKTIALVLQVHGYHVYTASNGTEALDVLQTYSIDLILADIAMPIMNGYQLYERVREYPQWVTIPFLFLTARTMDSDIRFGKQLGVDDYLIKPIQPEDLLAVIEGKLRRAQQLAQVVPSIAVEKTSPSTETPTATIGQLQINVSQHRAWFRGQLLNLSAREFALLEYLARHVNRVVPQKEIVLATHHLSVDGEEAGSLLRPLVRSLRRKLGYPVGHMGCIEAVRGVGYRLVTPE